MMESLKTAARAIAELQAKRRANWESSTDELGSGVDQELESLHLTQLDALNRHVESIGNGTCQKP